jgi:beta-N-acetylhexosaminidase
VDLEDIADTMASPDAAARAQQIADRGVTLLRNEGDILPLSPDSQPCLVLINSLRISQQGQRLVRDFRRKAARGQVFTVDTTMPLSALEATMSQAKECSVIVAASFAAITANTAEVNRFLTKLTEDPVPVVIATFNDPYMGANFPKAAAYLTPFSSAPSAEVAAAKALFGEIEISGHTPVTVPLVGALGAGIVVPTRAQLAQRR